MTLSTPAHMTVKAVTMRDDPNGFELEVRERVDHGEGPSSRVHELVFRRLDAGEHENNEWYVSLTAADRHEIGRVLDL